MLAHRRTTCLPKYMERGGYLLTAWKLGRYYRTYPLYVEDEVVANLDSPDQFERGPRETKRGTLPCGETVRCAISAHLADQTAM